MKNKKRCKTRKPTKSLCRRFSRNKIKIVPRFFEIMVGKLILLQVKKGVKKGFKISRIRIEKAKYGPGRSQNIECKLNCNNMMECDSSSVNQIILHEIHNPYGISKFPGGIFILVLE